MRVAKQRKTEILALLAKNETMTVNALAAHFHVSPLTIRRDLLTLEEHGVQRFHGGVSLQSIATPSAQQKKITAIAKAAAARIKKNDIVFVNSSSTALLALSEIKGIPLTAITNNGKALSTPIDPNIHLVLCGGDISFPKEALTGEFAVNNLRGVRASCCIMGISGMSLEMGLSTQNLSEVAVNQTMLERTLGEKIVVADSSKINLQSAFSSGKIEEISTLITDNKADKHFINTLKKMDIEVILVND